MSDRPDTSGPQFRADRPVEREAVRTTIVGGRPPGSGQGLGPIPHGIEILVKKASVDVEFKGILLERRAEAAREIGLDLDPAEVMMLRAVPEEQLETIIAQTVVPQAHRRAFLGRAAAAMLAALGLGLEGCGQEVPVTDGIRPDRSEKSTTTEAEPSRPPERPKKPDVTKGIQPDKPLGPRGVEEPKIVEPQKPEETSDPKPKENTLRPEVGTPEPGLPDKNPLRPGKPPAPTGSRPDLPVSRGIRPDRP